MKKKTIEQKAKAYDEALERYKAKQEYESQKVREFIEYLFPELKESEDERIRKEMIEILRKEAQDYPSSVIAEKSNSWIAWLEKQCEKGTNGNERKISIPEPPLTIKHAKEVMGIKQDDVWSEEDERLFQIVIDILDKENHLGNISRTDLIACVRKLKSLRPQNKWKPSESDIRILEQVIDGIANPLNYHATLHAILEKLKKLREE